MHFYLPQNNFVSLKSRDLHWRGFRLRRLPSLPHPRVRVLRGRHGKTRAAANHDWGEEDGRSIVILFSRKSTQQIYTRDKKKQIFFGKSAIYFSETVFIAQSHMYLHFVDLVQNLMVIKFIFFISALLAFLFFSIGGLLISLVLQYFLEEKRSLHFVNSVAEPYHNFLLFTLLILHHLRTYYIFK